MASIRQRKSRDGTVTYQVQVRREGFAPLTKTFSTKAMAAAWAREQDSKIDRGGYEDLTALRQQTVGKLLQRFLDERVPKRIGRRWETVRITMMLREPFAHRRLDQDVVGALQAWRDARLTTVSAATVVRDMNLLSAIFRTAMTEWRTPISVNPISLVQRPVVDKTPRGRTWSVEAVAALREIVEPKDLGDVNKPGKRELPVAEDYVLPALELSIETAMRRSELCGFRVEDVDLEGRRIWLPPEVTKTKVGRFVLLSSRAVDLVKELLQWSRRPGEVRVIPVNPDTLGLRFRQLRAKAGLGGLRLHDGRHTAVTNASKVFDNVLELSAFSGHRSLQSLKVYYHPNATELAKKLK